MQTISTELIKYQNSDKFPSQLSEKIGFIFKEINNKIYLDNKTLIEKSSYIKDIEELIKNRFNMNIVFDKELHVFYPAAVIPFFSDYLKDYNGYQGLGSNVMSSIFNFNNTIKHINQIEKERKDILNKLHNKKGYIDLRNARVGGYLSELKHFLIIDFFALINLELTAEEVTAVILHEVGHAFTGLEYHHKLESTNSTIADILNEINKNNPDKAVYIFKKHFTAKEFSDVSVNSKDEVYDFYGKIALAYLDEIKTQMVNSKYDETNFENLADSFPGRFNLSKDLVSGLHKLHSRYGQVQNNTMLMFSMLFFFDIMINILMLALLGPIAIVIAATMILVIHNSNSTTMTYDFPIDRYNRIKNSLINNLKNLNLPEALVKDLLEQYVFITETIEKSMYFKPIEKRISDILLSSNRNNNYYIGLQKKIEDGLNNELFLKSAQISIM